MYQAASSEAWANLKVKHASVLASMNSNCNLAVLQSEIKHIAVKQLASGSSCLATMWFNKSATICITCNAGCSSVAPGPAANSTMIEAHCHWHREGLWSCSVSTGSQSLPCCTRFSQQSTAAADSTCVLFEGTNKRISRNICTRRHSKTS